MAGNVTNEAAGLSIQPPQPRLGSTDTSNQSSNAITRVAIDTTNEGRENGQPLDVIDKNRNLKGWLAVAGSSSIFFVYLVSTLSFIGSLSAAISPFAGIINARIIRIIGYTATAFIGSFLVGLGELTASWSTTSVPAMFVTQGLIFGVGAGMCFMPCATVPSLWFDRKSGTATGIVYGGAGVGGAVIALSFEKLIAKVGLPVALRILGGVAWAICLPASLLIRSPRRQHNPVSRIQWHLLKSKKFLILTFLSALATFPLFVPPFLLPLYASAIGLSKNLGSIILAVWNLASALGRVGMGIGADRFLGAINSLLISFLLSGLSLILIWRFSVNTGILMLFSILNGIGSGGFFSLMPVVIGRVFTSSNVANALSLIVTTWTFGFFMGAPIAGYLLDAFGGQDGGTAAFHPAMFYAGSLTLLSTALLLVVRLMVDRNLFVKV